MATSTLGSGTLVLAGTTSGTTTVTATAVAGTTTLTLPAATDTLVGKATTDTLTNKTLTSATLTGVATFDAGTAALPAITTTGDTNTGIFFPAADTIAFTEGGAEAMRIDSSGNLLVGTTTAQTGAKLAVTGGIQGTITSGTAVASTSGTSIDFTSIPSWVKLITVMFNGVSLSGGSTILIQLGTTSGVEITGYVGQIIYINSASPGNQPFSSGIQLYGTGASAAILNSGSIVFTNVSGNIWVLQGGVASEATSANNFVAGRKTLAGVLDRVRITTVNGTDTFDAGSINILYEG